MRHALAVLVGFAVALGLATPAAAGESYLGTITVADGGVNSNWTLLDGGAFYIAPQTLVTIQPSANAYVCVDALSSTRAPNCSATIGVRIDANVAFPTSCQSTTGQVLMPDAGLVQGCTIAVQPVTGASVTATVWQRRGNEN